LKQTLGGVLKVAWSKVLNFSDPDQYTAAVRAADMRVFTTAKGEFRAELTQVVMNKLWMQRFRENLPRVHKGAIRHGRRVFNFLTEGQPEVYNRGRVMSLGEICADDFDVQHVRTLGGYRLGSASLGTEAFAAAYKAMIGCEFDAERGERFIRPNPDLMGRLLQLHAMAGSIAKTSPELFELPEVVRALEQQLVHALIRCVADGVATGTGSQHLPHLAIIARFEEFLEANPNRPLYLADVCAAVGAAERTLRAACEEHLGMGPIRYLTFLRMHLVRRALGRADPSTARVTQIAMDHGFWELGRFSVAYRELFGETPSASLRRPAGDWRVHRPSLLS